MEPVYTLQPRKVAIRRDNLDFAVPQFSTALRALLEPEVSNGHELNPKERSHDDGTFEHGRTIDDLERAAADS